MAESIPVPVDNSENPNTTYIFEPRRSGHHGIMKWLRNCYEAAGIVTAHVDDAYCAHLAYGEGEESRVVSLDEARTDAKGSQQLLVSFEDYPYSERTRLELYSQLGRTSSQDVLVLRDWPNWIASRLGLIHKEAARGNPTLLDRLSWDGAASIWTEYAQIMANDTDGQPHCINYNRWVEEPGYDQQVANRYGLQSRPEYRQEVPFNGGGSSFHGQAFDGRANDMDVLNRWNNLPQDLIPQFLEVTGSYPEADALSQQLFGLNRTRAVADLAVRNSYALA